MDKPLIELKSDRIFIGIVVCISIGLLSYTGYRAANLSFTYDESFTVLEYVSHRYSYIFHRAPTATNHILNTGLMKLSSTVLEPSEFVYRLPNLIAHFLYLLFSFLLVKRMKRAGIIFQMGAFILLNFNPYLLDFFSLARGYGLAAAFSMASLCFLIRHQETKQWVFYLGSIFLAALAAWSNFSALNLILALSGLFVFNFIVGIVSGKNVSAFIPPLTILGITCIGLTLLIASPISELVTKNELFFGGEVGIWSDTIASLIAKTAHGETELAMYVFGAMFIVSVAGWLISNITRPMVSMSTGGQLFLLFTIILIGLELQHFLFETRFIIERTALFLYPVFISAFIALVYENELFSNRAKAVVAGIFSCVFLVNFTLAANTTHYQDWKYEQHTKGLMQSISNYRTDHESHFEVAWPYSVTCKFYSQLYNYSWLNVVETDGPYIENRNVAPDFILMSNDDVDATEVDGDLTIPLGDEMMFVVKKKRSILENLIHEDWRNGQFFESDSDFIDLYSDSLNRLKDSVGIVNLRIELEMQLPEGKQDRMVLVLGTHERTIKSAKPKRIPESDNGWKFTLHFQNQLQMDGQMLKVFVWNMDGQKVILRDFSIHSFSLENN